MYRYKEIMSVSSKLPYDIINASLQKFMRKQNSKVKTINKLTAAVLHGSRLPQSYTTMAEAHLVIFHG